VPLDGHYAVHTKHGHLLYAHGHLAGDALGEFLRRECPDGLRYTLTRPNGRVWRLRRRSGHGLELAV
jgi:hypothetical protein